MGAWFRSDEESAYVEPEIDAGVQLDDDVVEIDTERALALLDRITHELPAVAKAARVSARWCAASPPRFTTKNHRYRSGHRIGKSLAYLIPAHERATRRRGDGTKNLQDNWPKRTPHRRRERPGVRVRC